MWLVIVVQVVATGKLNFTKRMDQTMVLGWSLFISNSQCSLIFVFLYPCTLFFTFQHHYHVNCSDIK